MKILIISQDAGSPGYGMVYRNYNLAKEFVEMGHSVTVFAASFAQSRFKQPSEKKENIDGIDFYWFPTVKHKKGNNILRVLNMFVFNFGIFFSKKNNWDVVIASSPNPLCIFPAFFISKLKKSLLLFDIRDLWPLTLFSLMNVSKRNPLIYLMQVAEDFACRNSDIILSVPSRAKEYLKKRGMDECKFIHIPNGIQFNNLDCIEKLPSAHVETIDYVDQKPCLKVGYCGSLGKATNIDILLEALSYNDCYCIHLFILGDGPEKDNLLMKSSELGLSSKVTFLSPVNRYQVRDFLSRMNAAYIGLKDSAVFKWGISPTKVNDYFLAGCPVIYAVNDGGSPFDHEGCIVRCSPDSVIEIINALCFLRDISHEERRLMGQSGLNWLLNNMDVSLHAKTIIQEVRKLREEFS